MLKKLLCVCLCTCCAMWTSAQVAPDSIRMTPEIVGSDSIQVVSDSLWTDYEWLTPDSIAVDSVLPPVAENYSWISYRGKLDFTDSGGVRTCNFFMVNRIDSILYLNLYAHGIEVMRMVLTPDSVIYVNKLTYQFYKGSYLPLRLLTRLPVDFQMVQALFNGWDEQLPKYQGFTFEYTCFAPVDDQRSFFTEMRFKDLSHLLDFHAKLKNVKFDTPGPTSIRIPDRFKELKF